ncbi:MAG: hypothetical protein J3R72DRAFT_495205 [Linnemannia gamsii]|nr:MAG: hypothetical protein J3R72DRAFT_495205 [Linnemannia gamsii]
MALMMRMVLAGLLFAAAGFSASCYAVAEEILVTAASIQNTPPSLILKSPSGRDESDADSKYLGHNLPAVYKANYTTIITRCTVPDNISNLKDYENTVKRVHREGHRIASHTWSHKDLGRISAGQVRKELATLDNALKKLISVKPVYTSPPFGSLSTTARRILAAMDCKVVL